MFIALLADSFTCRELYFSAYGFTYLNLVRAACHRGTFNGNYKAETMRSLSGGPTKLGIKNKINTSILFEVNNPEVTHNGLCITVIKLLLGKSILQRY